MNQAVKQLLLKKKFELKQEDVELQYFFLLAKGYLKNVTQSGFPLFGRKNLHREISLSWLEIMSE